MKEQSQIIQWIKAHKKQLILAGIGIAALIALVLGIKNKDTLKSLWTSLKGTVEPTSEAITETVTQTVKEFITSLTGSTNTIITSPTITTINIQESFRSYPCTFSVNNVQYEKEGSIIELNNIGDFIRNVPVNITISNNWLIIDRMEAYEIRNISIEEAIAVKLKDTDEYYLFRNMDYKKEDDIS